MSFTKKSSIINYNVSTAEIFIGIKKTNKLLDINNKEYFKINESKNKFELFEEGKSNDNTSRESISLFPSYIFEQGEADNIIMYENLCRNIVSDVLSKNKRYCFLTYGLLKTGKKRILFGEEGCLDNRNKRGLIYRFVENILDKIKDNSSYNNIYLMYNFYCIYQNKIMNLLKLSNEDYNIISEKQLISKFETIKPTENYEDKFEKRKINNLNHFIEEITKTYKMLLRLENKTDLREDENKQSEHKLLSRSSFIINIQITNNTNIDKGISKKTHKQSESLVSFNNDNNNYINSNLCFCSMSASNSNTIKESIEINTLKHNIDNSADIISLIQVFKDLQTKNNSLIKNIENFTIPSYLVCALKNNFVNCTFFKIIGCIFPAPCYYPQVKDTIMALKRLSQKPSDEEGKFIISNKYSNNNNNDIYTEERLNKEKEITNLKKQITENHSLLEKKMKEISKLNEDILQKDDFFNNNLEIIKQAFSFNGDLTKLITEINNEYCEEIKEAKRIRDCKAQNTAYINKIKNLQQTIEETTKLNDKIKMEKNLLENDTAMVSMYSRIKEKNLSEENKLKILLNHNKEKDNLKLENANLKLQVESLKKDLEYRNSQFEKLPDILKANVDKENNTNVIKDDIKIKYDKVFNKKISDIKENYKKEIETQALKLNIEIKELKDKLNEYKIKETNENYKYDKKLKEFHNEIYNLNKVLSYLVRSFKKTFDVKKLNFNNIPHGYYTNIIEEFNKHISEIIFEVNKYSYPNLFNAIEKNRKFNVDNNNNNDICRINTVENKNKNTKNKMLKINNENNVNIKDNLNVNTCKEILKQEKNLNVLSKEKDNFIFSYLDKIKKHKDNSLISNNINTNHNIDKNKSISNYDILLNKNNITVEEEKDFIKDIKEIKNSKPIPLSEIENYDRSKLTNLIYNLQELFLKVNSVINRFQKRLNIEDYDFDFQNFNRKKEYNEINKQLNELKERCKNQTDLANKYKIIIQSQERSINNYKSETFYKIEKDKLKVRMQSPCVYKKTIDEMPKNIYCNSISNLNKNAYKETFNSSNKYINTNTISNKYIGNIHTNSSIIPSKNSNACNKTTSINFKYTNLYSEGNSHNKSTRINTAISNKIDSNINNKCFVDSNYCRPSTSISKIKDFKPSSIKSIIH